MTSLIASSIQVMGDPTSVKSRRLTSINDTTIKSQKTPSVTPKRQTSIPLTSSFKDWWSSSKYLMYPTSSQSTQLHQDRTLNLKIEYDLYQAILSQDIYLVKPTKSPQFVDILNLIENSSHRKIMGQFIDVTIEDDLLIHEFYLTNRSDISKPHQTLVIIHGYMAALGYFVKNFESLIKSYPNLSIHVIDLPGFGNSSRPPFPHQLFKNYQSLSENINQIIAIESWFIDKLEIWRQHWQIRHFKLVGHSMGGYLSSCYLLKYNDQFQSIDNEGPIVNEFMIVSPMGTESSYVSLINDKKYQYNHHELGGDPFKEIFTKQSNLKNDGIKIKTLIPEEHDIDKSYPMGEDGTILNDPELIALWEKLGKPRFPKNFILKKLWQWNKSPFQLLQCFGPFYLKLLSYWSFQRFKNLKSNDESNDESQHELNNESNNESISQSQLELILKLHQYSYSIFNQYQGSGELAITKFINHEILPRLPLCDRGFLEYLNFANIKTIWMYGDKDWMNSHGGEYCVEKLHQLGNNQSQFITVKDAGHHIYLDNPKVFNNTCIEFFNLKI